ncbi:unnamed protein product [Ixodes persulcatus]
MYAHNGHRPGLPVDHPQPGGPLPALVFPDQGLWPPAPVQHEEPQNSVSRRLSPTNLPGTLGTGTSEATPGARAHQLPRSDTGTPRLPQGATLPLSHCGVRGKGATSPLPLRHGSTW